MKIHEPDGLPLHPASAAGASPSVSAPEAVEPASEEPPPEPTRSELVHAVASANRQMSAVAPSLEFEIDADTHSVVIRLVDRMDQRILRQVPSPEMLAIARALDRMQSLLVRTHA